MEEKKAGIVICGIPIENQQKWAFITAVIAMLFTHLYMFTNELLNHDTVNRLLIGDTDAAKIQHGRWAGVIFDHFSGSTMAIPYIIGTISTFAVACSCIILTLILRPRKKITTTIICLLICTFPVSANIFLYNYIADVYFISMFLATLGIWLILQKEWKKETLGVICLTIACGCYQAFWCLGIGFLFIYFLLELLEENEKWEKEIKRITRSLILVGISLVLYLIVNKFVQNVTGYSATEYQGLNAMGNFRGILEILKVIAVAYYEFLIFYYKTGYFVASDVMRILNVILTIGTLALLIKKGKEKKRTILYWCVQIGLICCIPLVTNLISIVSKNQTHALMQYGFVLPYFIFVMLLERTEIEREGKGKRFFAVIYGVAYLVICSVIYKGYITDNEVYFRQKLNYEATYSYTLRLLYRIEEFEGYTPDTQVAMINEEPQYGHHITIMQENYPEEMEYLSYLDNMVGTEPHTFVKNILDITDFCKYFHGYDLKMVDISRLAELAQTKEFSQMKTYPNKESMKMIDGVLVIKLPD